MDHQKQSRLLWVKMYLDIQDAELVCRRCGISRTTLRKWLKRYNELGEEGLTGVSRSPHCSPNTKIIDETIELIKTLRARNLGARRIQSELVINHDCNLSLASIHKVLKKLNVKPLIKLKRDKKFKRYQRGVLGERIQLDTCKIAPGIYQYTAVDDCSRWRVLQIYRRRIASNTLNFLDEMVERFPFPIQRIQTDKGLELCVLEVQAKLMEYGIRFRLLDFNHHAIQK
jgi:transposase-like protein